MIAEIHMEHTLRYQLILKKLFAANKEFFRLSLHKATSWQIKIYSYLNSLKLFVAKRIESVIQSKWLWAHSKAILACNSNVDHTVIWHLFISFNNLIMVIIFLCICHSIFNLNILDYTANISVHRFVNSNSYVDLTVIW